MTDARHDALEGVADGGLPAGGARFAPPPRLLRAWALHVFRAAGLLDGRRPPFDAGAVELLVHEGRACLYSGDFAFAFSTPPEQTPGAWRWVNGGLALAERARSVTRALDALAFEPGAPPHLVVAEPGGTARIAPDSNSQRVRFPPPEWARYLHVVDLDPAEGGVVARLLAVAAPEARALSLDVGPGGVFLEATDAGGTFRHRLDAASALDVRLSVRSAALHPRFVSSLRRCRLLLDQALKGVAVDTGDGLLWLPVVEVARRPLPLFLEAAPTWDIWTCVQRASDLAPEPGAGPALSPFEALTLPSLTCAAYGAGAPRVVFDFGPGRRCVVSRARTPVDAAPVEFVLQVDHTLADPELFACIAALAAEGLTLRPGALNLAGDDPFVRGVFEAATLPEAAERLRTLLVRLWGHLPAARAVTWSGRVGADGKVEPETCTPLTPEPPTPDEPTPAEHQPTLGDADADAAWREVPFELRAGDDRIVRTSVTRESGPQRRFREGLEARYGTACMLTGCDLRDAVDAAHIQEFRVQSDHHWTNGLLLRTDLHRLFDRDHLAFDPDTLTAHLSPAARAAGYADLEGRPLAVRHGHRPDHGALRIRWARFTGGGGEP
jgi:hypothetical protein